MSTTAAKKSTAKAGKANGKETPDLLEAIKPKRRGRPPGSTNKPKVTIHPPVKTSEQIADDIEAEILKLKPVTDMVAQMQQVADILRGKA